ncbi:MAG: serine/threonine-protein kinase [Myxococcota bacterium]
MRGTRPLTEGVVGGAGRLGASGLAAGQTWGRYSILETLGRGGMGSVFAAYDPKLDRRVALKVLHASLANDAEHHSRMLREAQALAKLSHPNVVSVYDVGELDGLVFIAMEFIDGPNVRQWLSEQERRPAEILAVFRGAGRGLFAAHRAGIVHRDFKPDNVLVDAKGRPYVTDFGLALEETSRAVAPSASASARLTQAGIVLGTPAYMPLEQHGGQPLDPRADQFSFCVSLYEALLGSRPFAGADARALRDAMRNGPPPMDALSVPRRVRRVMARGLSAKPGERFATMRPVLAALARPTRRPRTWVLTSFVGACVGAAVAGRFAQEPSPCVTFAKTIEDDFGPDARAGLRSAFSATGRGAAPTVLEETLQALDGYAETWSGLATQACAAEQSDTTTSDDYALQVQCLRRSRAALAATVEVLRDVQAGELRQAEALVRNLPDTRMCADVEALADVRILPATKAEARDAERLLPVLRRARVHLVLGRVRKAEAVLSEHEDALAESTYPLIRVRHALLRGRLKNLKNSAEGVGDVEEAYQVAVAHGLHSEAARAAAELGMWHHSDRRDNRAALNMLSLGAALARRSGSARLRASLESTAASVYLDLGRFDEAVEHAERALALVEPDAMVSDRVRLGILLKISETKFRRDGGDAGRAELDAALTLSKTLDPDSLIQLELHDMLNQRAYALGRPDEALHHAEKVLYLTGLEHDETSDFYARALSNTAVTLKELGRFDEALRRYESAYAIFSQKGGAFMDLVMLVNIVNLLKSAQRYEVMRVRVDDLKHQLEIREMVVSALGVAAFQLSAELELLEGRPAAGRREAERALQLAEGVFGLEHPRVGDVLTVLAEAELALGNATGASSFVERASKLKLQTVQDEARLDFAKARADWSLASDDGERGRAVASARGALEVLADQAAQRVKAEEIRAWLKDRDRAARAEP